MVECQNLHVTHTERIHEDRNLEVLDGRAKHETIPGRLDIAAESRPVPAGFVLVVITRMHLFVFYARIELPLRDEMSFVGFVVGHILEQRPIQIETIDRYELARDGLEATDIHVL